MERVHDGLTRGFPAAKRELGACADALHEIRNARTIVELGDVSFGRQRHVLERCFYTPDGAFGRFGPWASGEEEWQDNKRNVSCIPSGRVYLCKRTIWK